MFHQHRQGRPRPKILEKSWFSDVLVLVQHLFLYVFETDVYNIVLIHRLQWLMLNIGCIQPLFICHQPYTFFIDIGINN